MVIPKTHAEHFIDLDDQLAAHIVAIGNQIGRKIQQALKPRRVGFVVSGFGVPHVHYHIIPMWDENDITSCVYASIEDNRIIYSMKNIPAPSPEKQLETVRLLSLSDNATG
jgi:histidine triad (HIT) family protein